MTVKFNLDEIPVGGVPVVFEVTLGDGTKITQKGIIEIEKCGFAESLLFDMLNGKTNTFTFTNKDVINFTPTEGAIYDK